VKQKAKGKRQKAKSLTRAFFLKPWILLFASCGAPPEFQTVQESRILMDTVVSINVYAAKPANEPAIRRTMTAAFTEMSRLDSLFSAYRNDSETARLNHNAAAGAAISSDMDSVLQTAQWAAQISNGAFDITVAPILQLWGFGTDSLGIPAPEKITARLARVNHENLVMTYDAIKQKRIVTFRRPEMAIDLGGVAKGYVVDRGLAMLQQAGIRDAMITAGGDLRTLTSPLTARRRYIWIQHPRPLNPDSAAQSFWGRFKLEGNAAVSTSGDYERFFIHANKRYHHIMDPHTGYPGERAISVTVIAATSVQADALSTTLFVLGPVRGLALADSLPQIEALVIYHDDGRLNWKATAGLAAIIEILKPSMRDSIWR